MVQADSVHSTQSETASKTEGLLVQERKRREAIETLARLRKEASAEIDRLLGFLDASDPFHEEREDAVDDNPCCDNELDGPENIEDEISDPDEPSLGSINDTHGSRDQTSWGYSAKQDLEADSSDDEPSLCGVTVETYGDGRDLEGDDSDQEPSLGWTIDGATGNWDDRELQNHLMAPVERREAKGVTVEDRGYGGRRPFAT